MFLQTNLQGHRDGSELSLTPGAEVGLFYHLHWPEGRQLHCCQQQCPCESGPCPGTLLPLGQTQHPPASQYVDLGLDCLFSLYQS